MSRLRKTGVHLPPEWKARFNRIRLHQSEIMQLARQNGGLSSDDLTNICALELDLEDLIGECAATLGKLLPTIRGGWGLTAQAEFVYVEDTIR